MIQKAVGISFRPTIDGRIMKGTTVKLIHDKDNQYSSKAIGIEFDGRILGYVGEKGNADHERIFEVLPLEAKVITISRLQEGETFGNFKFGEITHLEIEFPMSCDDNGLMKSFNEDISLKFLKAEHKYVYDGKELVSGTKYIKRWIAEFDKENIARACAGSYGCSDKDVLEYWKKGGEISASFGTAIHDALEHYEKFKWLGDIIQAKKELAFNPALPNHPALRQIVEDFYKQDLREGLVKTEVLVTNVERGLCGFVDRLLMLGTNKCRVQDYKININSEELDKNTKYLGQMADLPKNKLSKYQLQLSFYARLLQLSGMEVEGLDVFVYENEWKHYELPILKLDF
jgi:hypothetical protein